MLRFMLQQHCSIELPTARRRTFVKYLKYLADYDMDQGRPRWSPRWPQHKMLRTSLQQYPQHQRLCPAPRRMSRQSEITLPFQRALEQIGDASAGTDHLRAIIG